MRFSRRRAWRGVNLRCRFGRLHRPLPFAHLTADRTGGVWSRECGFRRGREPIGCRDPFPVHHHSVAVHAWGQVHAVQVATRPASVEASTRTASARSASAQIARETVPPRVATNSISADIPEAGPTPELAIPAPQFPCLLPRGQLRGKCAKLRLIHARAVHRRPTIPIRIACPTTAPAGQRGRRNQENGQRGADKHEHRRSQNNNGAGARYRNRNGADHSQERPVS